MEIKAIFFSVFSLAFFPLSCLSQVVIQPNSALKSHETLDISKVEITSEKTMISLLVVNRKVDGTFCADRNISIVYPDGEKIKSLKATGIPACPDEYKFKSIGEKLQFIIEFPPLKTGTQWFDIIEECSSNCFWFYGVTLNSDLNKKLDEAFALASKGKPAANAILFRNILEEIDSQNVGIEGLLYVNIINAAVEDADKVNAMLWYKRLASSHAPRTNEYIKYLNDKGIKF